MNQDTFMEVMVKRDPTLATQLKKCAILLAALMIAAVCIVFLASQYLNVLAAALLVGTGWIAFLLIRLQNVEYEYIITNGEMDIDKIEGKSKRKRLATVELSAFSSFAPMDPQKPVPTEDKTKILAAKNMKSTSTYVAELKHKELGDCVLYFTPDEKMIECIERERKFKRVYVPSMGR